MRFQEHIDRIFLSFPLLRHLSRDTEADSSTHPPPSRVYHKSAESLSGVAE